MKFNTISALFIKKHPNGEIERVFVSLPGRGLIQEESKKITFENDGAASTPGLKFRYSPHGKWYLSRQSLTSFAKTQELVEVAL